MPLGSIMPCSNSQMVSWSQGIRKALVPINFEHWGSTLTRVSCSLILKRWIRSKTTWAVIILVRLATYRESYSFLPKRTSPEALSSTIQDCALTKGAGFSMINFLWVNISEELGRTEILKFFFFRRRGILNCLYC